MTPNLWPWQRWLLHLVFWQRNVGTICVGDATESTSWVWHKAMSCLGKPDPAPGLVEQLEASYQAPAARRP